MPPILRQISRSDLAKEPQAVWNAFIDLIAVSDYEDLQNSQRPAHLIFWYESEVQNGGHLQFFVNRGTERIPETIESLRRLGAMEQAEILERAAALWNSRPRVRPSTVDEFVDEAMELEFEDLDGAFCDCPLELTTVLERHLADNESAFIIRI